MKQNDTSIVILCGLLLGAACSVRAEGWFLFANSPTTLVMERNLMSYEITPVATGGGKVEFLYAELGTTEFSLFRPAAGYAPVNINPVQGRFAGGTIRLLDIEPAATISALVRGWTGSFATWDEAVNSGTAKLGISDIFQIATTDSLLIPPPPPANMVTSVPGQGFTGLILGVPEPTSFSLIALALGGMILQRTSKQKRS